MLTLIPTCLTASIVVLGTAKDLSASDNLVKRSRLWGGSPGIVVKGEDSRSRGCGFKSQHWILDVNIVLFLGKNRK